MIVQKMVVRTTTSLLLLLPWLGLMVAKITTPYSLEDAEQLFERFIQEYKRQYNNGYEKQARFTIFKDNLEKANRLNKKSKSAVFGINQFSDLTLEEFHKYYTGLKITVSDYHDSCPYFYDKDIHYDDAPESFDWRDHNVVTAVQDQGACGGCYAFSSTGNIEGQYAIKHNQLIELSQQQIIDCDRINKACAGGLMCNAFRSLIEQGGSESEVDYPYIFISDDCHFNASKVKVKLVDCRSYNLTSQEKVKQLLYHNGPISIGVKSDALKDYTTKGGIISDDVCFEGDLDHAVLLVGYGLEKGDPYWIVKNSWGVSWGEHGYFRMHRGEGADSCGMMNDFMSSSTVV